MRKYLFIFLFALTITSLIGCGENEPTVIDHPVDCQPENFTEIAEDSEWTTAELSSICSLWIGNLPDLPDDPSNAWDDDPAAAAFGMRLFFEPRLSKEGTISCSTCHDPAHNFRDATPLPVGGGQRRTPTIVGAAYSPWFFWDGHKDSLWAQALEPLEAEMEHGGTREQYAALIASDDAYRQQYESIFGTLPDVETREGATEVFVNMGKAIAAYERQVVPMPSPFDAYAQALLSGDKRTLQESLSEEEVAGHDIYMGAGRCLECHNGPLFTNNEFHGTAVVGIPDDGRATGAQQVLTDEFNCRSEYSDTDDCPNLEFIRTEGVELEAAFKTPTLRNIADMPPYSHNGSFATLADMLQHYNLGGFGTSLGFTGHNQLVALNLSETELAELEAFLRSLSGGVSAPTFSSSDG